MIDRSSAAKYATSVFFQKYNDIDVYVEDTAVGYQKIYANLLCRAIGNFISIERVFPLGARTQVTAAAQHFLENTGSRKSVFIVDGDLFLLMGEPEALPQNVITLPRYCIENFLYDEESLVSIIDEETHAYTEQQIREKLDYKNWLEKLQIPLRNLFIDYAIAQTLGVGLKTVSLGYQNFCLNKFGEISTSKIQEFVDDLRKSIKALHGDEVYECTKAKIEINVKNNCCFVSTYVSAKDISLSLLLVRIRQISETKASNLNLKLRLSKKCDISPLKGVSEKIFAVINS